MSLRVAEGGPRYQTVTMVTSISADFDLMGSVPWSAVSKIKLKKDITSLFQSQKFSYVPS